MKEVKPGCFILEDSDEKEEKVDPLTKSVDKYAKHGLKQVKPGYYVQSDEEPSFKANFNG